MDRTKTMDALKDFFKRKNIKGSKDKDKSKKGYGRGGYGRKQG